MRNAKTTALVFLTALTMGCASVVHVYTRRPPKPECPLKVSMKRMKGVPFYIKVGRHQQTTVYHEVWSQATLRIVALQGTGADIKEIEVTSITQAFVPAARDELRGLQSELANVSDAEGLRKVTDRFLDLTKDKRHVGTERLTQPVSNYLEPIDTVDYSKLYFINAPLPWFGSATLTAKVAADGTLSEASATSETKLAEAISSVLPIKEWLTSTVVPTKATGGQGKVFAAAMPQKAYLNVEQRGYVYTFTKLLPTDPCFGKPDEKCLIPIAFDTDGRNYRRTELGKEEEKKKEAGKSIEVNGTIELPKP